MKKLFFLLPLLALCLGFTSCSDDDNTAKKYAVAVTALGSDSVEIAKVTNITVSCKNMKNGRTQTVEAINGGANFNLATGQYTFTVKGRFDGADVEGVSQIVTVAKGVADDFVYNVQVALNFAAAKSSLIFKEVYFTGVPEYFFRDAFYEIVNNADTTVYLDGVIVGIVDNGSADWFAAPSVWVENGLTDAYPCNSHTVYFPGTGKDYPLAPGQSVVMAASALNHKAGHPADAEGNVESPVDLSNAEFEVYIKGGSDSDNPDVPNMEVLYSTFGFDFMPATDGKDGLLLARLEPGMSPEDFAADTVNFAYKPGTSYMKQILIPRKYVLDAIDIVASPVTERYKKLQKEDDRSYVFVDAGKDETGEYKESMYCGRSIRRKVVSVENGIAKFKDTNNSEEDFVTELIPVPHRTFTNPD